MKYTTAHLLSSANLHSYPVVHTDKYKPFQKIVRNAIPDDCELPIIPNKMDPGCFKIFEKFGPNGQALVGSALP